MKYTESQIQRLKEFGDDIEDREFSSADEREKAFSELFSGMTAENDIRLENMIRGPKRHVLSKLESDLAEMLTKEGFIEVRTPLMISNASLEKMTITRDSELYRQVYRIDDRRCLRPMLAPNLYFVMRKLRDRTKGPVRIFEIGSCFRKESKSSNHLDEFTMLNFVELGPSGDPVERLKELISKVMNVAGIDYDIKAECSEVYKETLDVEVNGTEMASGAVGPHVLDAAHDIHEPWCGAGFGLERLLTAMMKKNNAKKVGRSLAYLNGAKIERM
ncbi:MAG: pyrrolysine--tRNA(Pyl) ligase large subunit [Methanomassiliicoccaceae archaeon]|nr:pyrrolysine--tRNA(Pyl) ligase large subunit [Methanomassiliicoccaceae archaeon]